VRAEVFLFLAAVLLCCVGLFLPAGQLDIVGAKVVKPATISVFELGRSEKAVKDFLTGYRDSTSRKIGARVLGKVAPHLKGRARSDAGDVQDAMAALDQIKDEDIKTVGTITAVVMWSLFALNVLGAYLVIGAHPALGRGRGRAIGALVTSLLAAALAVGVYLVLGRVVAEANNEVGAEMFSLRAGAYVIPAGAVAALAAAIALQVAYLKKRA
jgi:hypothetical protein